MHDVLICDVEDTRMMKLAIYDPNFFESLWQSVYTDVKTLLGRHRFPGSVCAAVCKFCVSFFDGP